MVTPPTNDPDIATLDVDAIRELNPLDKHHMRLRWAAIFVAILTIIAAGILEVCILRHSGLWQSMAEAFVFLAIAPIACITIIVTFIQIGSFRKSGDAEMSLTGAARLAGQTLRGTPE